MIDSKQMRMSLRALSINLDYLGEICGELANVIQENNRMLGGIYHYLRKLEKARARSIRNNAYLLRSRKCRHGRTQRTRIKRSGR